MKPHTTHIQGDAKKAAATNARSFRTFLLMQQFERAEIGARIAQARKESGGMTQIELGELLNVSTRSVQDYEAGVTMPWKHFQRLETIFSRSLHWFLHGEAEEPTAAVAVEKRLSRIELMLEELVARSDPDEQEEPTG